MEIEEISRVEILENGEMYVVLASGGKAMYQHIYREAAEVYWDNEIKCFKATAPRKWSHLEWFLHIIAVAKSGLGITLEVSKNTSWVNVPSSLKEEIYARHNT